MSKLKFQKMWETGGTFVFDIDSGSIRPMLYTLPKAASFADKNWFFYCKNSQVGGAYYEESEMAKAKLAGLHDFLDDKYRQSYFNKVEKMLEGKNSPVSRIESANLSAIKDGEL